MNTRLYFTLVAVVYLIYGLWYFLDPQGVSGVYGFGDLANPLSGALLQFLGIYCLATGVMCGIARNAERSPARTGVLAFLAVAGLLSFYLDVKTLMGEPGTMDYVDTVLNGLIGFVALYFIVRDRGTSRG